MSLPSDIWYFIADILHSEGDYASLYTLSLTSPLLDFSIPALYDFTHIEASKRPWSEDAGSGRLGKWAKYYRTLIESSQGKTSRNYVHFIKVLDILDLEWFLESVVRDKDAQRIITQSCAISSWTLRDVPRLITQIVGMMVPHCVNVREVSREPIEANVSLRSQVFVRWIEGLHKLKSIRVLDGQSLTGDVCAELKKRELEEIDIYSFTTTEDQDGLVEAILLDLCKPWRSFTLRTCKIGDKSLKALAGISTLKHLELWSWKADHRVLDWGQLAHCSELEEVALLDFNMPKQFIDSWRLPFRQFFDGAFKLRILQLENVAMPVDIAIQVMQSTTKLEELKLKMSSADPELNMSASSPDEQLKTLQIFADLLGDQARLRELELCFGLYENIASDATVIFREPLSKGREYRRITIGSSANAFGSFKDEDIPYIGKSSRNLEVLRLASFMLSDTGLANLDDRPRLKWFESMLPSHVSDAGLLSFVKKHQDLENLLFVGTLQADVQQEIQDILTSSGGRFTCFEPYVARNDYGLESDSDVDEDYVPN